MSPPLPSRGPPLPLARPPAHPLVAPPRPPHRPPVIIEPWRIDRQAPIRPMHTLGRRHAPSSTYDATGGGARYHSREYAAREGAALLGSGELSAAERNVAVTAGVDRLGLCGPSLG